MLRFQFEMLSTSFIFSLCCESLFDLGFWLILSFWLLVPTFFNKFGSASVSGEAVQFRLKVIWIGSVPVYYLQNWFSFCSIYFKSVAFPVRIVWNRPVPIVFTPTGLASIRCHLSRLHSRFRACLNQPHPGLMSTNRLRFGSISFNSVCFLIITFLIGLASGSAWLPPGLGSVQFHSSRFCSAF